MKNSFFSRLFRSMVELLRPSRRIQKEQSISPEQFQKMLAQTLADPDFKLMLLKSMAGTVWPIMGGFACGSQTNGTIAKFCDASGDVDNSVIVQDGSGNIGIGTGMATILSLVNMAAPANPRLTIQSTDDGNNDAGINFVNHYSGSDYTGSITSTWVNGGMFFTLPRDIGTFGYFFNSHSGVTRMYIDSALGNVGIGTTSPLGLLDLAGKVVFLTPSGDTSGATDTTNINAAISALTTNGGIVYLSGGLFYVGNLTGKSNVHLVGAGRGATILQYNGDTTYDGTNYHCSMIAFVNEDSNFSIREITWDYHYHTFGSSSYKDIAPILVDSGCNNFDISDCSLVNLSEAASGIATYGIIVQACRDFWIERNIIVQPNPNEYEQEAILLTSGNPDQPDMKNGVINANHCDGAGFDIFAYDTKITNNVILNNAYGGCIFISDDAKDVLYDEEHDTWIIKRRCHDLQITGNTIYNSTGPDEVPVYPSGIENWSRRSIISGNTCYKNSGEGIFNAGENCVIADNLCYNNGQGGSEDEAAGISLGAEDISGPDGSGLSFVFNSSYSVLVGNRCFNITDDTTHYPVTQTYGIEDHAGQTPVASNVIVGVNSLLGNTIAETSFQGTNYVVGQLTAPSLAPDERSASIAPSGIGGSDPFVDGVIGDQAVSIGGLTPTGLAPTSTEPRLVKFTTGSTSGNKSGINGSASMIAIGLNLNAYFYLAVPDTTNILLWVGFTDNVSSLSGNGNPSVNYIGFRYSTADGDTTWRCRSRVAGSSAADVDSGQAPSASGSLFSIHYSAEDQILRFRIDGAQVAEIDGATTPLPTSAMAYIFSVMTQTSAGKNFTLGWLNWKVSE